MDYTKKKWYENFMMIALFFGYGLVFMDRFGIAMLFPMVAPDLKLNATQLGLIMSSLAVASGIFSYVIATFSDILGKKKIFLVGAILVFSICTLGTGLATSFAFLLVMRFIMGMAEGPTPVLAQATMMAISSEKRKGFNIGFVQSASNLMGTAVAAVVVLGSAQIWGWRGAMTVLAIPGIIVAILLMLVMKEPPLNLDESGKRHKVTKAEYASIFKTWNVWVGMLMTFGMLAWWLTTNSFITLYFVQVNKYSTVQIATFFTFYGIAMFVSNWIVPLLSDRVGRKPMCIIATGMALLSTLVVLFVHTFSIMLPLMAILLIIGAGSAPVFMVIIPGESVPKAVIATTISLAVAIGDFSIGSTVPALAGFLSDKYGIQAAMWVAFGGAVFQFVPSLFLKETLPSKVKKAKKTDLAEA